MLGAMGVAARGAGRSATMDETAASSSGEKRGRRGGGGAAARRAARTGGGIRQATYITRATPEFEVLGAEALEIIEQNAETVLEEVGIAFVENPAALARWKAGGYVHGG